MARPVLVHTSRVSMRYCLWRTRWLVRTRPLSRLSDEVCLTLPIWLVIASPRGASLVTLPRVGLLYVFALGVQTADVESIPVKAR